MRPVQPTQEQHVHAVRVEAGEQETGIYAMSNRDELDALRAQISIYRSMLFEILALLPGTTLDLRREVLEGMIRDLRELWGPELTISQANMIDAYEVIEFFIRHREKFARGKNSGRDKPYLLCRKCETSILFADFTRVSCPVCKTGEWLELVYA